MLFSEHSPDIPVRPNDEIASVWTQLLSAPARNTCLPSRFANRDVKLSLRL